MIGYKHNQMQGARAAAINFKGIESTKTIGRVTAPVGKLMIKTKTINC
jgi:hypothetical protein